MIDIRTLRHTGLALSLGLSLAACAQQQSPPPAQRTGGMSGMGMQGQNMSGMNMQQMMAHCAEMRQQMRPGATMSADMQGMMAHCDQMGGMSGAQSGTRGQAR
jgi:hypothetical protein